MCVCPFYVYTHIQTTPYTHIQCMHASARELKKMPGFRVRERTLTQLYIHSYIHTSAIRLKKRPGFRVRERPLTRLYMHTYINQQEGSKRGQNFEEMEVVLTPRPNWKSLLTPDVYAAIGVSKVCVCVYIYIYIYTHTHIWHTYLVGKTNAYYVCIKLNTYERFRNHLDATSSVAKVSWCLMCT